MKRLLSLLILFSIISLQAATNSNGDAWYQIVKLSTPTIVIGGKTLKTGDKFHSSSKIKWVKPNHSMLVKNLNTLEIQRFSKTVFAQKGNVTNISDFFIRINMASTRGVESDISLQHSPVAGKFPERRIALVLGNSIYNYIPTLWNAQRDAEDITSTLLDLGFDVIHTYECNYTDMSTAVNRFATLAKDYQVAFFYYSGHGIQEDDINYLIPVDNMLERRDDLRYCLSCNDIVERVENSGCPSKIFFFDACRNRKSAWSRSALNGLSSMEGSVGTVIAFATQSGKVATDGERGDNSPFAKMLMKNMCTPNLSFSEMMTSVVRDTYFATNKKQYPVQVGNLIENFRFNPIGVLTTQTKSRTTNVNDSQLDNEAVSAQPNISITKKEKSSIIIEADKAYKEAYYQKALQLYLQEADTPEAQTMIGYMYGNGKGVSRNYVEAIKWYRKAAEQGYALAQSNLGIMYYNGYGVTKDYAEALKWYRKAAEQNHTSSIYYMAQMIESGKGITKNYTEASRLYRKAADLGHDLSQYELGYNYEFGYGLQKNFTEAFKWYQKSAQSGVAKAQYRLGKLYDKGNGTERNYDDAIYWYRKAAEQGYSSAQCDLGYMYERGLGVTPDINLAIKWYSKASDNGSYTATYNLGLLHKSGRGVKQDYLKAIQLFEKAANEGYSSANYQLGVMHEYGYGVQSNYSKAIQYYRLAADKGHDNAQNSLGIMYESGKGISKNLPEAASWYLKSAENGNAYAQCNLANFYQYGKGVDKDEQEAFKWYQKSAQQGNARGLYNVGYCYGNGIGVDQNYSKAIEWYLKSAEQGNINAYNSLGWSYYYGKGVNQNRMMAEKWLRKAADKGSEYAIKFLAEHEFKE